MGILLIYWSHNFNLNKVYKSVDGISEFVGFNSQMNSCKMLSRSLSFWIVLTMQGDSYLGVYSLSGASTIFDLAICILSRSFIWELMAGQNTRI